MIVKPLVFPLLPLLGWGVAAIAGAIAVKKVFFDEKEVDELKNDVKTSKKIAILGLHQAGKTTFLRFLQGDKNYKKYVASGMDEYDEFDMKIHNKTVTIAENNDIGGGEYFVKNYKTILQDSEMAFFLFDVSLFFNDNEYYRDFCARVDYLKGMTNIKTYFIATHPDKLNNIDDNKLKIKITEKLQGKHYQNYVEQKLFVINLLDEKKLNEFVNKVFL